MPAWAPDRATAGWPACLRAIASSVDDTISPVDSSRSSSRSSGASVISAANASSSSVVSPIAETTTTSRSPPSTRWAMRAATPRMRSALPTEVPPYFWTMSAIRPSREGQASACQTSAGRLTCRASVLPSGALYDLRAALRGGGDHRLRHHVAAAGRLQHRVGDPLLVLRAEGAYGGPAAGEVGAVGAGRLRRVEDGVHRREQLGA